MPTLLALICPRARAIVFAVTVVAAGAAAAVTSTDASYAQDRILVFSRTTGFRHSSIPNGIRAIQELGQDHGFEVIATEDASIFNDEALAQFGAVVFLNTTGDILSPSQESAYERYIQSGGGFVGIHSAADTEYGWSFYGELVGAYFLSHPAIQVGEVRVADKAHPATAMLPPRWSRRDEWYNYRSNPRGKVHVLATLAESSYSGGSMGHDHPIAWCRPYAGGRSWYTGGGHTDESFDEDLFRQHILGGIEYASGRVRGDCTASIRENWSKTILEADVRDPMELEVAPDGRVFFVERRGLVRIHDPNGGGTITAGTLSVYTGQEDGLLGIALDPQFEQNQWIYLFYSPAGPTPKQHVSRFTLHQNQVDVNSEQVLLEIPVQRVQCCHSAGSLAFGPDGTLFISTGDDTNPFSSDGFAPIDERTGFSAWDAQKSSSNASDLRGKILRIRPLPDGSYEIPQGNLFPLDGSGGRPEIYVMGNRNPFRIAVDPKNGWLYWGDVGPDASSARDSRGPAGHDEWNQARSAGNYGWPYCIADNKAYVDYDFATGVSGPGFDCIGGPVNDSPNNTGPNQLPSAKPAWIWYPYGNSPEFPEVGSGGRTAMGGPVYYYDPQLESDRKLPAYYDGTVFIYEWSRNWIREVKLDEDGNVLKINPFASAVTLQRPMDMELGPDGALYVIEWGSGFGGGNADAQVVRLDYEDGNLLVGTDDPKVIDGLEIVQPFPNPTAGLVDLSYVLDRDLTVTVEVFDVVGRRVAVLAEGAHASGSHRVTLDTENLASGVYLYRISTPLTSQTGQFVVVK